MKTNIRSITALASIIAAFAAAQLPGYEAAFVNYRMIASDVWSTAESVKKLGTLK